MKLFPVITIVVVSFVTTIAIHTFSDVYRTERSNRTSPATAEQLGHIKEMLNQEVFLASFVHRVRTDDGMISKSDYREIKFEMARLSVIPASEKLAAWNHDELNRG